MSISPIVVREARASARFVLPLLALFVFAPPVLAQDSSIEEIVVTARKREETIQDIPIAINAFGTEDLDANQIGDVSDLQFNVPNVTYTKTNFSGAGSFSIRGIGTLVVATSSDPATGIHVNTAPVQGARIFETEFFDTERIEILRGPQGTLYGRNASAGLINVITREADDEFGGYVNLEAGDYEHFRGEFGVSIPLAENHRFRLAAYGLDRGGYTENLGTDNDIDDRSLWGIRGTLSGDFGEDTNYKLMVSWFEERDSRLRIQNQGCTRDENPYPFNIGCRGGVGFDPGAWTSSLSYQVMSIATLQHFGAVLEEAVTPHAAAIMDAGLDPTAFNPATDITALGAFAMDTTSVGWTQERAMAAGAAATAIGTAIATMGDYGFLTPNPLFADSEGDPYRDSTRPNDRRQVRSTLDPIYETYEFMATLELEHTIGDFQISSVSAVRSSWLSDSGDYTQVIPSHTFNGPRPDRYTVAGEPTCEGNERYFAFPGSPFDRSGCTEYEFGFDWANARSQLGTTELRIASDLAGPFNFTAGVSYLYGKASTVYGVYTTGLEEFARFTQVGAESDCDAFAADPTNAQAASFCGIFTAREMGVDPATLVFDDDGNPSGTGTYSYADYSLYALAPEQSYFDTRTHPYTLDAFAAFGEAYYEVNESLRLTAGVRWTRDEKEATATGGCLFGSGCDTLTQTEEWNEVTGKLGVDWNVDESTLLYGVISRGFKGGGFNPGQDPTDPRALSATFDPEEITSFEIGSKSTFLDGALVLNTSAFFYDYSGFQVAKIVNRTAINENIDAEVLGAELEAYWFPIDNLSFDFAVAYLDTEISSGTSIDTTDPADGKGVAIKSPALSASNVVVPEGVDPDDCVDLYDLGELAELASDDQAVAGARVAALAQNSCVNAGYFVELITYATAVGTYAETNDVSNAEAAVALAEMGTTPPPEPEGFEGIYAGQGAIPTNLVSGFETDLTGNRLPNAPEFTIKVGATYTQELGAGWTGTARVNYYWQDDMWGRIFNKPRDVIDSWDQLNAQVTFASAESPWTMTLWAKNLTDEDAVTGHYFTDETSGNFTNLFILDPRTYGVTVRYVFGGEAR